MGLLLLLLALCWEHTASNSATVHDRVRLSPHAYSLQRVGASNGILSELTSVQVMHNVTQCQCSALCLADAGCRGYGYSEPSSICLLTASLPKDEPAANSSETCENWQWHARAGVRQLGEPCTVSQDCSLLVPGATCVDSVCHCRSPLEEDGAGGCRKSGGFVEVSTRQLTSRPLAELTATSIDDCRETCAGNITCVAFDFAVADGLCRLFAEGVTSDADGSGSAVQTFVWRFSRPDGTPPDAYQEVNGTFLRLLPAVSGLRAADACFSDSAVLFPGVSTEALAPISDYIATHRTSYFIWIGMEDMLEEGVYTTSVGGIASNIAWDAGQQKDHEDCGLLSRRGLIHDARCETVVFNALCEYVGENLALGKLSWMNTRDPTYPAANGNDGNVASIVHTPQHGRPFPTATWTVDLGDPVQVTSVLYVARVDCCDGVRQPPNRNRFTEIRVGSHPALFDGQHSARCVLLERPFMARGYARLFRCAVPVTGRYVRLIRDKREPTLDFADLAVFGNRLRSA